MIIGMKTVIHLMVLVDMEVDICIDVKGTPLLRSGVQPYLFIRIR